MKNNLKNLIKKNKKTGELDILKKDWENPKDNFKEYSENEIFSMIQKKSLNIANRLIIIAVLEILIFNGIFWLRTLLGNYQQTL